MKPRITTATDIVWIACWFNQAVRLLAIKPNLRIVLLFHLSFRPTFIFSGNGHFLTGQTMIHCCCCCCCCCLSSKLSGVFCELAYDHF
jgi:hypothetical protein